MQNNPTPRRAEHLHTKRCLGTAMISAIENARDLEFFTDYDFALYVQENRVLEEAHSYLADGTATCLCNADGTSPCLFSCCDYGLVDGIVWQQDPAEKEHMERHVPGVKEYGNRLDNEVRG